MDKYLKSYIWLVRQNLKTKEIIWHISPFVTDERLKILICLESLIQMALTQA